MSLKNIYEPYFKIGTSVSFRNINSEKAKQELKKHYNSFTCENEMKPMHILDEKANTENPEKYNQSPALYFDRVKPYLEFAKANGIGLRGHTLCWHNQTPFWFFKEGYSKDRNAPLADRETMLARLESYIKGVLEYTQTEYPGVIYAWDVVNEAMEENEEDCWRKRSLWYQTVGTDFVLYAFRFARKYADKDVKLFYNDYNTFQPFKRDNICEKILKPLMEEKLIDGMGMQAHLVQKESNLWEFQAALHKYGETGLEIQLTELDIHSTDPTREGRKSLSFVYESLFGMLVQAKKEGKANVSSVTFWGMKDDESWLTGFRKEKSYPLLFGEGYKKKEAYYAVARIPGQIEGDTEERLPEGDRFDFWEKETVYTKEYHVNPKAAGASDENDGSEGSPFATIQAAANVAKAGERVLIHGGVYRECVQPAFGGEGPDKMVSYEAYGDGEVVIKASEIVEEFEPSEGWSLGFAAPALEETDLKIWEVKLNPEMFKGYNPFCAVNILHDRLFIEYDKTDMTTYLNRRGMVFCDGKPLQQVALYNQMAKIPGSYWVEANGQTVHFRLAGDANPAEHCIELTVREQCFVPVKPFLSYIKVKGITCAHAATGAPVPQRGAISCYRGHHWVIENCKIDWSNGVGIDIGNECWHHTFDPKVPLGYTVIRSCEIRDVGVCGIAGMFATHLLIEDNLISGTGWQKMELSWEAGAIKTHNTIDSLIRRNIFEKTFRADHLWLDCGNENNRITSNLFLDGIEQREAIFIECSRDGINLIDNNIFWNIEGRFDPTQVPAEPGSSGWYKMEEHNVVNGYAVYGEGTDRLHIVNNLIGNCRSAGYFAKPVAFRIDRNKRGGTSREACIYNNIFYECKEAAIKFPTKENDAQGNLYVRMPGGFLRILYPAPEALMDLQGWQEFYSFDTDGQQGWFDIQVDTGEYTLSFGKASEKYGFRIFAGEEEGYLEEPSRVGAVGCRDGVDTDFYGVKARRFRIPGPFMGMEEGRIYSIDPRKQK